MCRLFLYCHNKGINLQGKTHFVVGVSLALAIMPPSDLKGLIAGCVAAGIGSVVSDVDCVTSNAGQEAVKASAACVIMAICAYFADSYFKTGIFESLVDRGSQNATLMAVLAFVLLCAFGMLTSHRSFLHSIAGGMLLTLCTYFILPDAWKYFAAGCASHLALDLLNRKGIRLFFPLHKTYCLGWFKANGLVNRILLAAGTIAMILLIYTGAKPHLQEQLRRHLPELPGIAGMLPEKYTEAQ